VHGAGYRGIYDLGDPDGSLYMISTGQSGNLYSRHYDDLLPLWAEGGYVKIPITPQAIANSAAYTLTLQPLKGARLP
jgi:penicillin amidase